MSVTRVEVLTNIGKYNANVSYGPEPICERYGSVEGKMACRGKQMYAAVPQASVRKVSVYGSLQG